MPQIKQVAQALNLHQTTEKAVAQALNHASCHLAECYHVVHALLASADIEQGEAVLTIANQEVVNADGTKVYCPEAYNAKVMIGGVTGVATASGAEATESIASVYNAVGIKQSKVQSGLNIIVKKDGEVIKATK